jgi:hypothetical protein
MRAAGKIAEHSAGQGGRAVAGLLAEALSVVAPKVIQ